MNGTEPTTGEKREAAVGFVLHVMRESVDAIGRKRVAIDAMTEAAAIRGIEYVDLKFALKAVGVLIGRVKDDPAKQFYYNGPAGLIQVVEDSTNAR